MKNLKSIYDLLSYLVINQKDQLENQDEELISEIDLSEIFDLDKGIYDENGELLEGLENLEDERVIALAKHLGINAEDANDNIENDGDYVYTYYNNEYNVFTDSEAENAMETWAEVLIEDELYDIEKQYPHVTRYINTKEMLDDYINDFDRGQALSSYNGVENEETVLGTDYYIYRTN